MAKNGLGKIKRSMWQIFGIGELRPGQEDVIRSVLEGKNTLAIMATGAGKSLCYQLPALHLPGTTVIVSPLISLMKDQVDKLREAGLDVSQVNSALKKSERDQSIEQIKMEKSEFVFTTPERLADPAFVATLASNRIDFVVIDEAHCISEWGHDFRPAFLGIGAAIKSLGSPPVLALTATATAEVVRDIEKQLGVGAMRVFNTGIYRPNLRYEVLRVTNEIEKRQHLLRLFREIDGHGIVYASTVKTVEAIAEFLKGFDLQVERYHGKLSARERKNHQDRFMADELKCMIATNAFGMGIDKPDIRFVIHYNMPGSLEAYYQESGRAGRDGRESACVLLYQLNDRRTQLFFLQGRYPKLEDFIAVHASLKALCSVESSPRLADIQQNAVGVSKSRAKVVLSLMKNVGVIKEVRGSRFKLLRPDIEASELEFVAKTYSDKSEKDREKLERMMLYGQSARCRWNILRDYFGEESDGDCGTCDNCVNPVEGQVAFPVTGRAHAL